MANSSLFEITGIGARDGVWPVRSCRLKTGTETWSYSKAHAAAIDAHWHVQIAKRPVLFNGPIHLLQEGRCEDQAFEGTLLRADFKSYLHWREAGFQPAGVLDAFGSALIRSREGHVLLGRQRAGNVNAGVAYLPGGFIDHNDVTAEGTIDVSASILRELHEETGLTTADVRLSPGFLMTRWTALLSFALEVVSPLPAEALRAQILAHIAEDPQSELTDAVIVRTAADIAAADVHPYARILLEWLFSRA